MILYILLSVLLYQLEMLIQEHCPELHTHFKAHEFSTSTFASKWFLTLFCSVFQKDLSIRILDIFFVDGIKVIFRVGLGPGYIFLNNRSIKLENIKTRLEIPNELLFLLM